MKYFEPECEIVKLNEILSGAVEVSNPEQGEDHGGVSIFDNELPDNIKKK